MKEIDKITILSFELSSLALKVAGAICQLADYDTDMKNGADIYAGCVAQQNPLQTMSLDVDKRTFGAVASRVPAGKHQ